MTRSTSTRAGRSRLRLLGLGSVTLVVVAGLSGPAVAAAATAPLLEADPATDVPGSYIVVLKHRADSGAAARLARRHGGRVNREFHSALRGYSANLSAAALAEVRKDPEVAYVEQDRVILPAATQLSAPWGLDRIDQAKLPLSGTYTYGGTGAGVTVYVIDSGILASHTEFGGRVAAGADFTGATPANTDCYGHGTHVAGTIGGATYGVAKGVTLVPVRVIDCKGSSSIATVISAVDWVAANRKGPAVVNLSMEATPDPALDAAVQASIDGGLTYVVAAGNGQIPSDGDACNVSPARLPDAITVAASTSADAPWRSSTSPLASNTGRCVDLFAPGASVKSAWYTSTVATATGSGTSMAAPHVAGAAALYLQANPAATGTQVRDAIVAQATGEVLNGVPDGTPNELLFSPVTEPGPALWLAKSTQTAGDAIELNSLTASSGWASYGSRPTRFPAQEGPNGFWQPVNDDLWNIRFRGTGGTVELRTATAATNYTAGRDWTTVFGAAEGNNGIMHIVGADLWYVRTRSVSATVDVFAACAVNYAKRCFAVASRFPLAEADHGVFQVANGNGDLWFIRTDSGSGSVEVRKDVVVTSVTGAKSYQSGSASSTCLSTQGAGDGRFLMVGDDLWFIKVRNTDSGKVELYSATAASGYQSGVEQVTGWSTDDADTGTWWVN
jgi:subtilisin family serine protease